MSRVHLAESEFANLRREVTVVCGKKLVLPIAACVFDEAAMNQSLDLGHIKGLCTGCRKAWKAEKNGRRYVFGLVERDQVSNFGN